MKELTIDKLQSRIDELEARLQDSEELINAIRDGEVDAFAINKPNGSEVFTLQSGDYAYRVLIEKIREGAVNVSEDGLIVYTNPYFCSLLGRPYDEVIGAPITDFIHKDSRAHFREMFMKSVADSCKGEVQLKARGTSVPVFVSLTSLQPKLPTVGIIVTDYTEKKRNENLISAYQKDLEQNNNELLESNAELESFVYIASHDLQEPLRKIQTFASIIREKERESLSNSGLNYFNRMESAAYRMQTLINDLLAYSRTNKLERSFEYCSLEELLEEVKVEMCEELGASGAIIEHGELCHAHIIPFQFKQLLTNLISNSLKFTKDNQVPRITICSKMVKGHEVVDEAALEPDARYFHLKIADDGIGFQQKYSEKIFELFQRVHGKSRFRGTGIGLAIVKKIVDNHSGIIRASSLPGQGATFDIYFPHRLGEETPGE